jgi:hypothetical protein
VDDADDTSILLDGWEGKIIGEKDDGYVVPWKSSFIPKKKNTLVKRWFAPGSERRRKGRDEGDRIEPAGNHQRPGGEIRSLNM